VTSANSVKEVKEIVREVGSMLKPDGDAELLDFKSGVVRVRYLRAENPVCEECVMHPDDFAAMLSEMLRLRCPDVTKVELEISSL
jgi:Fe-S cluster biogenesis protein NfuA